MGIKIVQKVEIFVFLALKQTHKGEKECHSPELVASLLVVLPASVVGLPSAVVIQSSFPCLAVPVAWSDSAVGLVNC